MEEARTRLLALAVEYPDDAHVHYQTAWTHDAPGLEREAAPFYERALVLGLHGEDLAGALLGLGSAYRTVGQYGRSIERLRQVFLAMALYNAGEHHEVMELLLRIIADTSDDESIRRYNRAITFYAGNLDRTW